MSGEICRRGSNNPHQFIYFIAQQSTGKRLVLREYKSISSHPGYQLTFISTGVVADGIRCVYSNNNQLSQAKGRFLAGKVSGIYFPFISVAGFNAQCMASKTKLICFGGKGSTYVLGEFRIMQVMTLNEKSRYCLVRNGEVRTFKSSLHITEMHQGRPCYSQLNPSCRVLNLISKATPKYGSGDVVHCLSTK